MNRPWPVWTLWGTRGALDPDRKRRRFLVLVDPDGAWLLEQRPPTGIWGGLWWPPERDADATVGGFLDEIRAADVFRHGFTHYDLDVEPVYVRLKSRPATVRENAGRWIDPNDHRLGLSTVAARLVAAPLIPARRVR